MSIPNPNASAAHGVFQFNRAVPPGYCDAKSPFSNAFARAEALLRQQQRVSDMADQ
jgi:hypothetical protein